MNATRATELSQDSQRQDFQRQDFQRQDSQHQKSQRQIDGLDDRYGKIGISAVAAAVGHQRRQRNVNEYRIPYDRD